MEKKAVLNRLLKKEQSLREKATDLKSDLESLNSEIVSKQSGIDCLLARVAELKSKKRKCKFPSGENNGEGHQGRKRIKLNHEWMIEPERLAETVLHEEMWREVFSKVDDGFDLLNASQACQHFHDILDPLNNNFLFEKIIAFLFLHLNLNDALKCRLVCRDWSSAINSFLGEWTKSNMLRFPSYRYSHPLSKIPFELFWTYQFAISPFVYSKNAKQFLQQFNSSARTPFVTNSIYLMLYYPYYDYSKTLQYRKGISSILDTFGRHIHHAQCCVDKSPNLAAVELLRELFRKAKNLQTLVVSDYQRNPNVATEFEDITSSLPNLNTLFYNIEGKNPIGNWLCRNLHLQITKLQLCRFEALVAVSEFTWSAVTELRIDLLDMDEEKDCLKYLGSFPGLKKLCIFIWRSTIQNILCIIHHLPKICPSFHALQLHLADLEAVSLCEQEIIVNAPKELDTLEFNLFDNWCWSPSRAFDFLPCFPFIKKLSLVLGSYYLRHLDSESWRNSSKLEIIELYKYFATNSNPRSSNIWRMLPNLETLQLQNKIYKRLEALYPKLE